MSRDFQSVSEVAWSVRRDGLLEGPTDNDTDCAHSQLPSVKDYYTELSPVLVWVIAVSTVAVLSTCAVYVMSLWHVLTRAAPTLKSPTSYVLTIHPVAAVASYISVMIPRTYFLMEALVQDLFTICVYQMFCLLAAYYEQEAVSRKLRGACIRLSTGPCCCLPCCRRLCTPVPLTSLCDRTCCSEFGQKLGNCASSDGLSGWVTTVEILSNDPCATFSWYQDHFNAFLMCFCNL
ncbi:organic solute transporter subunit alpha-like [Schistocerca americana]|uniref:organic solute transporter subunit alpha-like n=1 Tax=Schistocerca americana TaxID=7009 RepID=UPI001F4FBFF6|nr:organic solute transporter subunit alpha-like [Schistocerca americana]